MWSGDKSARFSRQIYTGATACVITKSSRSVRLLTSGGQLLLLYCCSRLVHQKRLCTKLPKLKTNGATSKNFSITTHNWVPFTLWHPKFDFRIYSQGLSTGCMRELRPRVTPREVPSTLGLLVIRAPFTNLTSKTCQTTII